MADVILSLHFFSYKYFVGFMSYKNIYFLKKYSIYNLHLKKNVRMHFEFRSSYILQFLKNNIGKIIFLNFTKIFKYKKVNHNLLYIQNIL